MSWRAAVLGLSGLAPMLACCSNPAPSPSPPAEGTAARPAHEWRPPIIATAPLGRDYLAAPTGSFEIADGCLSFDVGEMSYTPVFDRSAPPHAGPGGLIWGGRLIRYGEKVRMGGGQAGPDVEIDADARRKCPGPFTIISSFPPRDATELEAVRKARTEGQRREE
jgi:hypothetical protein